MPDRSRAIRRPLAASHTRDGGTLLIVTESGFDSIPAGRGDEAFRMNSGGWAEQMKNIQAYVVQSFGPPAWFAEVAKMSLNCGQNVWTMRGALDGSSRQWDDALARLKAFVEK